MVTGGFNPATLSTVEVFPDPYYNRASGCYPSRHASGHAIGPADLPVSRYLHVTFLTAEPSSVIATCGGLVGDINSAEIISASCLVPDKANQGWDESMMGNLTIPREASAVASLMSVGVYVIGGDTENSKRTSDFQPAGSMQWREGPTLPEDMDYGPCAVTITTTSFLVIQGWNIHEFNAEFNPTSIEGWREAGRWPSLKRSRTYWPGCAKLGQKVIIAGGYYNQGPLRSTEVLDLDSREITAGGDMASPRYWFHLATIRREGEEKVFAVGGNDGSAHDSYLNTAEEWVAENATWRNAGDFLGRSRGHFGAVTVPEDLICQA